MNLNEFVFIYVNVIRIDNSERDLYLCIVNRIPPVKASDIIYFNRYTRYTHAGRNKHFNPEKNINRFKHEFPICCPHSI